MVISGVVDLGFGLDIHFNTQFVCITSKSNINGLRYRSLDKHFRNIKSHSLPHNYRF